MSKANIKNMSRKDNTEGEIQSHTGLLSISAALET